MTRQNKLPWICGKEFKEPKGSPYCSDCGWNESRHIMVIKNPKVLKQHEEAPKSGR